MRPLINEQFKEVYEREIDALFRFCVMRVSNREQAKDIVQDVFVELWQVYLKGEIVKNDRALLYTILRNKIIDWYRKKKAVSLDAMISKNKDEGEYAYDPPDLKAHHAIVLSAEVKRLVEAIDSLAPNYRDVVYLRLVEDLSPEQIGQKLGHSANTISVRITRGIQKLRKYFNIDELTI